VRKKKSIIIPTYNEAGNIVFLITKITEILKEKHDYEIIVADDDSPDGTWKLVEEISQRDDRIKLLRRIGKKKGLSPSIVDAFKTASGDVFIVMDADGQHDVSCLPVMIDVSNDNDMVIGTRFASDGAIEDNWPFYRLLASRLAAFAARAALKVNASDPMSGFFAISKDAFESVSQYLDPEGFKIMLELLFLLKKTNPDARVFETGIKFKSRKTGQSKLGTGVVFSYFKMLMRLRCLKVSR
jgi:dolichol-phosphate mannosyltransferase